VVDFAANDKRAGKRGRIGRKFMSIDNANDGLRMNRRMLLGGAATLLVMSGLAACQKKEGAAGGAPVATTKEGQLKGATTDGIHSFKGVHYGATTAGGRFQPPKPPAAWEGVKDALDFGNQSPQLGAERPTIYASWLNPRPASEDCLVLNVYTPGLADGKKRPVMVWYHGGGFTSGSSSSHYADGTRLAKRGDVVVVTVNHRLNAFGYLYLADVGGEAYADSGNVGSLDMIRSLEWVRDNAEAFGGDPANVTIFGQSGGGGKVSHLCAMPGAKGLFHKAIVQSGSGIKVLTKEQANETTKKVMAALGLQPNEVDKLVALPVETISAALPKIEGAEFRPVVDGRSTPRHPFDPDAPEVSKDVPMLIGTVKDETTSLVGGRDDSLFGLTWETLPARLGPAIPGMDVTKVIADIRRVEPDAKPSDVYFTATTEARFRPRAILQAERKVAQGGAPAFMYFLQWETPVDGGKWKMPHSGEHALVFDNIAKSESMVGPPTAENQKVADAMSNAWIAFAKTGNPGWPAYNPTDRPTMVFDVESKVVNDPRKNYRLLFKDRALA